MSKKEAQYSQHPITKRLALIRALKGITQVELAEALRIPATQYFRYEKGQFLPHPDMLVTMANVLGVSMDWLMGRVPLTDMLKQTESDFSLTDREIRLIKKYRQGVFDELINSGFLDSD